MEKPFVMLPLDEDLASYFPESSLSPQSLLASWRNPGQRKAAASHSSATAPARISEQSFGKQSHPRQSCPSSSSHNITAIGNGEITEGRELPKPPSHISCAEINASAWPQLGTVQWRNLWNKSDLSHWILTCSQAPKCAQRWLRTIRGDTEDKGF